MYYIYICILYTNDKCFYKIKINTYNTVCAISTIFVYLYKLQAIIKAFVLKLSVAVA